MVPTTRRHQRTDKNAAHLVVEDAQVEDSGVYSVSARSPAGVTSRDVELRVTADGDSEDDRPAFLRRLNDRSVKIGTRARLLVETKASSEETVSLPKGNFQFFKLIGNI